MSDQSIVVILGATLSTVVGALVWVIKTVISKITPALESVSVNLAVLNQTVHDAAVRYRNKP